MCICKEFRLAMDINDVQHCHDAVIFFRDEELCAFSFPSESKDLYQKYQKWQVNERKTELLKEKLLEEIYK